MKITMSEMNNKLEEKLSEFEDTAKSYKVK
jgi:hypothetical protein